jgi:hypothetical protein
MLLKSQYHKISVVPVFLSLLFLFLLPLAFGPLPADATEKAELERAKKQLALISSESLSLRRELEQLKQGASSDRNSEAIGAIQNRLDTLASNFEDTATLISQEDVHSEGNFKINWTKEVEELALPLLESVRSLTERPRKIEQLKKKIELYQNRLRQHEKAVEHIRALKGMGKEGGAPPLDPAEGEYLKTLALLEKKYDPELAKLQLEEAKGSLQKELDKKASFFDDAIGSVRKFFKARGRNLFVTFLVFAGMWWAFTTFYRWVISRQSPAMRGSWFSKLLSAAYNALVLGICLLSSLFCLYLFDDWLLISVVLIVLISVAWTSRQWIPRFLKEVRLILNLGTVREGERMVWKGTPWLLKDIGFYATLVNECLEGGRILLPVGELIGQYSRPVVKNEPWFPTKINDWVFMGDNTYGSVQSQTMEQVVLRLKGGSLKYYSTDGFLAGQPRNISTGFMYDIEFGLDYGLQARICDEIPKIFETSLEIHLKPYFQGDTPDFRSLEVRFRSADASSLNLMVIIEVAGRCADRYRSLKGEINTALVRICNENNFVIPFNQTTVNLSRELMEMAKSISPS